MKKREDGEHFQLGRRKLVRAAAEALKKLMSVERKEGPFFITGKAVLQK